MEKHLVDGHDELANGNVLEPCIASAAYKKQTTPGDAMS
jgi:hypothetical protein